MTRRSKPRSALYQGQLLVLLEKSLCAFATPAQQAYYVKGLSDSLHFGDKNMLPKKMHLHFMGIGGIGQSALAKVLRQMGHTVSGCDKVITGQVCDELRTLGCSIEKEHSATHVHNADTISI